MKTYIEEEHVRTPVTEHCDVLVAGGGVAGIAAALAAARSGASVILTEKQCVLGGLATSGLVAIYLPLCDGCGRQVSYGIAEELFRMSVAHGAQGRYPAAWLENGTPEERKKQRFEVQFNPVYFALEAERLLTEAGVKILYDTRICAVRTGASRLETVVLENQDGRTAVGVHAAVDATGDASLFFRAGRPTRLHGRGNTLAGWYYAVSGGALKLHMLGFADAVEGTERDVGEPLLPRRFRGDSAGEISEFLTLSHQATLADALKRAGEDSSFEPVEMVHMPQYRMTRCLCGAQQMTQKNSTTPTPDSVGMVGDWRKRGPHYEVPYAALYDDALENLYAAGRCISADDDLWDVMRAIPACAVTGQAAGTAAALTTPAGRPKADAVRRALRAAGQKLDSAELDQ